MNILLVLPPSQMSVLCSTALIRVLHRQLPHARLQVLVPAGYAAPIESNPFVTTLTVAEGAHTALQAARYDVVIDLASLEENRRWAKEAGVRYLPEKGGLRNLVENLFFRKASENSALRYLALARPLSVAYDGWGLDYYIPEGEQVAAHDIPAAHSAGYVIAMLSDASLNGFLGAFAEALPHPVIIGGTAAQAEAGRLLAVKDPVKIYNACGKFSVHETVDLVRRARVVVAGDPYWVQVAAVFGRPAVCLQRTGSHTRDLPPLYAQQHLQTGKLLFGQMEWRAAMANPKGAKDWELQRQGVAALIALVRERL